MTLFSTTPALDLTKFSVTGNSDYYLQQNAQDAETNPGAVTLQLHAAKDSEGNYYDDLGAIFQALSANRVLTILDGQGATYAETFTADYDDTSKELFYAVAQIGETKYPSLSAAVSAATDGQTVTLLKTCSEAGVALNDKTVVLDENGKTFGGSFTGNGILALPAGTLLNSPSSDRWASGWTGTVWIKGVDNIIGTGSATGKVLFEPNKYGREGSVLRLSGVKGWILGGENPGVTINPTIEIEDATYGYGLWLNDGYGYNGGNSTKNYTVLKGLKGTGTLIGDGSGGNVLLQVEGWNDFAGTLALTNKVVVFGSTLPEDQGHIEGGGYILVKSGESVEVPAGKTWTVRNGVIVYGNLSLGAGASIENITPSSTWVKRGTGIVTLNALADLPATPANDWTGTVVLPSLTASSGWSLNQYGNSGSTVEILGITGGWISEAGKAVAPKLKLTGDIVIGAMSSWEYSFSEITGGGNLSFATTGTQPSSVTISKVAEGYTGTISSTLTTSVTIGKRNLSTLPACDDKVLAVGGTGPISLDVSNIKIGVNEESLPAKYKVERRVGEEGDGFYVYYNGTIFSVY